jgi:hypothetical protein
MVIWRKHRQRIQIGDTFVTVREILRRRIALYIESPPETFVRRLGAVPKDERRLKEVIERVSGDVPAGAAVDVAARDDRPVASCECVPDP